MEEIQRIVGRNVRQARKAAGLSQEALADSAGIDRTYVSGVERGVRNPTVTILDRLAKALGVTPADLLRQERAKAAFRWGVRRSPAGGGDEGGLRPPKAICACLGRRRCADFHPKERNFTPKSGRRCSPHFEKR